MSEPEWMIWEAPTGYLELDDGRRVLATGGDEVLVSESERGVIFLDHRKATKH